MGSKIGFQWLSKSEMESQWQAVLVKHFGGDMDQDSKATTWEMFASCKTKAQFKGKVGNKSLPSLTIVMWLKEMRIWRVRNINRGHGQRMKCKCTQIWLAIDYLKDMRTLDWSEETPPQGSFPIYYVPSSRTVCKRTPLEEPGTNPTRGVLLHTVLDEGI